MDYDAVFFGLLSSLLFTGLTGYYPGGMIVPSYLVLFVHQPLRILATWFSAIMTLLCFRLASHYLILFGRRRFVFMILIGGAWAYLWLALFPHFLPLSPEFRVIGWVVPGLIANHFESQGIAVTTASLVTVVSFVYFLTRAWHLLF